MTELTDRQKQILNAVVESYAEVAAPVGSALLAKLFNVSSATIRNEMAVLERLGLIEQPHTSAGRIPSDKGYRVYVNSIANESNEAETVSSQKVIDKRITHAGGSEKAIQSAVRSLVEITHNVGLATIGDRLYVQGFANLFSQPEFLNTETVQQVARLLDNLEPWLREAKPNQPLSVFIGHENPIGKSSQSTLIISRYASPFSDNSYIGVLGPTRQDYRTVMNLVARTGQVLERNFNE